MVNFTDFTSRIGLSEELPEQFTGTNSPYLNQENMIPEQDENFLLPEEPRDFFENLADSEEPIYNSSLPYRLKEQIDNEFNARSQWYDTLVSGLNALGLTTTDSGRQDPTDDNDFDVINPTFLQTLMTLVAQFSDDLFKANNVVNVEVKNSVSLNSNPQTEQQAGMLERLAEMAKEDINYKITNEWDDILPQIDKGMRSAFLTGSAIFKVYFDEFFRRPVVRFIPPENILIPPDSPSLGTAERITHVFELSESQAKMYMRSGFFKEFQLNYTENDIDPTSNVRNIKREIQNIEKEESELDNRSFWFAESEVYLSLEDIADPLIENSPQYTEDMKAGFFPYNITTHKETGEILNITRAWDQKNLHNIVKINNLVHFLYMPGEGFWGEGLNKSAIKLHNQVTTVMQQLYTSLRKANTTSNFMSTELTIKSDQGMLGDKDYIPVQTSTGTLDGMFHSLPYNQPNPMYYEYMKDLEGKISNLAGISSISGENIPSNMQASVLFSLIEKETKPMSGVMKRFITGINGMYKIIQRIMSEDLGQLPFGDDPTTGLSNAQVYGSPITLLSSCDPTLSNSSLRVLQMQTMFEYASQHPELHNMLEMYQRLYESLKITNVHQLLITKEQYEEQQQQNKQMQQQQMQQQQQQVQAQQQQIQNQNNLLSQELQLKAQKQQLDNEIAREKLSATTQVDQARIAAEMNKAHSDNVKQRNIEAAQIYESQNRFLIDQYKLELERMKLEMEKLKVEVDTGLKMYLDHTSRIPELNPAPQLEEL